MRFPYDLPDLPAGAPDLMGLDYPGFVPPPDVPDFPDTPQQPEMAPHMSYLTGQMAESTKKKAATEGAVAQAMNPQYQAMMDELNRTRANTPQAPVQSGPEAPNMAQILATLGMMIGDRQHASEYAAVPLQYQNQKSASDFANANAGYKTKLDQQSNEEALILKEIQAHQDQQTLEQTGQHQHETERLQAERNAQDAAQFNQNYNQEQDKFNAGQLKDQRDFNYKTTKDASDAEAAKVNKHFDHLKDLSPRARTIYAWENNVGSVKFRNHVGDMTLEELNKEAQRLHTEAQTADIPKDTAIADKNAETARANAETNASSAADLARHRKEQDAIGHQNANTSRGRANGTFKPFDPSKVLKAQRDLDTAQRNKSKAQAAMEAARTEQTQAADDVKAARANEKAVKARADFQYWSKQEKAIQDGMNGGLSGTIRSTPGMSGSKSKTSGKHFPKSKGKTLKTPAGNTYRFN
jgi:hypothetical protein